MAFCCVLLSKQSYQSPHDKPLTAADKVREKPKANSVDSFWQGNADYKTFNVLEKEKHS